jgi:alkylated DNA repair dioxygenase AlkB
MTTERTTTEPVTTGPVTTGPVTTLPNAPQHSAGALSTPPSLAINRQAPTERTDLGDGRSWVTLTTGFVPNATALFDEVHETVAWQQAEVLRYDRYVAEKRLGGFIRPDRGPTALRQTDMHLASAHRVRFDGVAAILYRDGADFQGLHSDREMRWLDDTLIAIVVLGVRRPFVFRQRIGDASFVDRTPPGQLDGDVVLMPGEGDLLVMGGRNQRDWLHAVPAADTDRARISLTWRWTSKRGAPDNKPGYFDGRQFSDHVRQPGTRSRPSRPTR